MATNDRDDHEQRIDELRQSVKDVGNGEMLTWVSPDLTPDRQEEFWRHVLDAEAAPSTTDSQRLAEAGVELPEPDLLNDDQVTAKLWEVITALANLRVFISQTDHLSDRELYARLWHDQLRQEIPALPDDPASTWHVDILGGCSDADIELYLTYYADENYRGEWLADYPNYKLPEHRELPFDRDRWLPCAGEGERQL
jgi:hypothetical protein